MQIGSSPTKLCGEDFTGDTKTVANVVHAESKVCVNLKLTTEVFADEISWEFGGCSGPQTGSKYTNSNTQTIECCQPPGDYTMKCKDSYGDGWNGAYIQVGSSTAKVCKDFTTGTTKSVTVNHPASP